MFSVLIEKLQRRQDLSMDEASQAMEEIMEGRAQPAQIAGLLIGLSMKGERPAEIVGLARTMRARATPLSRSHAPVFDTCGTGGDRAHTFNVSTVAALVLAACGVRVAKHGNRSVSSRCGSADRSEALASRSPPSLPWCCLEEAGIAFFFAPTFHLSMRHAARRGRIWGAHRVRPLDADNWPAPRDNSSACRGRSYESLSHTCSRSGSERAWVVHGADGLDEISTTGYTKVSECRGGAVNTFYVHPADFGLPKANPAQLRGGDAAENAAIARRVLAGEPGAPRDVVLLNAAASLLIAERAGSVAEGIAQAAAALDEGGESARDAGQHVKRPSRGECISPRRIFSGRSWRRHAASSGVKRHNHARSQRNKPGHLVAWHLLRHSEATARRAPRASSLNASGARPHGESFAPTTFPLSMLVRTPMPAPWRYPC
jgi:anthranilate phosphoribosyltransferase